MAYGCSWARTYDNDDDGAVQDGGHTPAGQQRYAPLDHGSSFGIGHPCYDQLTPAKLKFPMTTSK